MCRNQLQRLQLVVLLADYLVGDYSNHLRHVVVYYHCQMSNLVVVVYLAHVVNRVHVHIQDQKDYVVKIQLYLRYHLPQAVQD